MINVYDFDKTIYLRDSSIDLYFFCLKKKPWLIRYLPYQVYGILLYKLKKTTKEQMKSHFFVFLKSFQNKKELVQLFWKTHQKYITKWYLDQKQNTDVIISASPEFLLKPLEKKLKIKKIIATKVDQNGVLQSKNCEKEEKVIRFYASFPKQTVNCFYSDSVKDQPMADIAQYAYLVNHKKKQILDWRNQNEKYNETL